MTINDKYAEIIVHALAEIIKELKTENILKDAEIEQLRERVAQLEKIARGQGNA
jgi:hypothetical protein